MLWNKKKYLKQTGQPPGQGPANQPTPSDQPKGPGRPPSVGMIAGLALVTPPTSDCLLATSRAIKDRLERDYRQNEALDETHLLGRVPDPSGVEPGGK